MKKMRTFSEYLMEVLVDREEAIGFIQAVLEEYQVFGNTAALLHGLQTVVEAQGGVSELAKQSDIAPEILSKALSNDETPLIDILGTVAKAFRCRLSIEPLEVMSPEKTTVYADVAD